MHLRMAPKHSTSWAARQQCNQPKSRVSSILWAIGYNMGVIV